MTALPIESALSDNRPDIDPDPSGVPLGDLYHEGAGTLAVDLLELANRITRIVEAIRVDPTLAVQLVADLDVDVAELQLKNLPARVHHLTCLSRGSAYRSYHYINNCCEVGVQERENYYLLAENGLRVRVSGNGVAS